MELTLRTNVLGHLYVVLLSKNISICRMQSDTQISNLGSPGLKVELCVLDPPCAFTLNVSPLCLVLSSQPESHSGSLCVVWAGIFTLKSQFMESTLCEDFW